MSSSLVIGLWEIWLIDGLESGDIAYVAKLHHALADGTAASGLLENIMSVEPGSPIHDEPKIHPAVPLPKGSELIRRALREQPGRLARLPKLLGQTIEGGLSLLRNRHTLRTADPNLFHAPTTPFNGALGPQRHFDTAKISFTAVKDIKQTLNVTVNDVVLALVAGTLRRYLKRRGTDLSRPLIATVPVAFQEPGSGRRLVGNRLSNLFTSLATHIEDPVERIRAIHHNTTIAKSTQASMGETLHAWTEYLPPKPYSYGLKLYSGLNVANWHPVAGQCHRIKCSGPQSPALCFAPATQSALFSRASP